MNYKEYRMSVNEIVKAVIIYAVIDGVAAYFFYRSLIVFFFLMPGVIPFMKLYRERLKGRRLKLLKEEFAETLRAVSAGLTAGYSLENAFLEAHRDMRMFYGEKSLMADEIVKIRKGLGVNITLEDLIKDLSERSGDEDIAAFSDVLFCAKRYGGNVTEVLRTTSESVREKICVDKEIELTIAEKKLELRMMEVLPFFILLYLRITSVGYFDRLYEGLLGRVIMTACMAVYIGAALFAERLIRIEV